MIKFAFLIFLFPTICFSQTINTTTKRGQGNIYSDAVKHFITFTSKSDKSIYDTLLILKDDLFTDSLQTVILTKRIVLVDSAEISNRLQVDKSFVAYKIFPLNFDNGHFYVNIVPFVVRKDKNEIALINTGTCVVSYTYDSKAKLFRFYRATCNGF
jgi:hypothetical protein